MARLRTTPGRALSTLITRTAGRPRPFCVLVATGDDDRSRHPPATPRKPRQRHQQHRQVVGFSQDPNGAATHSPSRRGGRLRTTTNRHRWPHGTRQAATRQYEPPSLKTRHPVGLEYTIVEVTFSL